MVASEGQKKLYMSRHCRREKNNNNKKLIKLKDSIYL